MKHIKAAVFLATCGLALALDVYLVPQSHCDAGWLLTDEQYFSYDWPVVPPAHQGSGGSVRSAIDTILADLLTHPTHRFVWSETIWISKWWTLANASSRAALKSVAASGQLEFVGGGWVQGDECTTNFEDVVDQTTTGHEFLRNNLNATVSHGYQIDMFAGYSGATPSLWALSGYEAMVLRFEGNTSLRAQWEAEQSFQFAWRASNNLPANESSIMAHVINGNYCDLIGQGFNYEETFKDPVKNPPVTPANVADRAAVLVNYVLGRATSYRGPVMELWGCDFAFHDARAMFGNMSLVVDHINANASYGITIRFSTLREYFDALHAAIAQFPVVHGLDFLLGWPHRISGYNVSLTYQTGAQTSWPNYKSLVRSTGDTARSAESAFALSLAMPVAGAARVNASSLASVREARGLTQHHDSVPGTMRTNVSSSANFYIGDSDVKADYESHLHNATTDSRVVLGASLQSLTAATGGAVPPLTAVPYASPLLANGSILVYNPLGWARTHAVRVVVPQGTVAATVIDGETGAQVPSQVHTSWDGSTTFVSFIASVPALGYHMYGITPGSKLASSSSSQSTERLLIGPGANSANLNITNGLLTLVFDGISGALVSVATRGQRGGAPLSVTHDMAQYRNATGGAYILYESGPPAPLSILANSTVTRGPVFSSVCAPYDATQGVNAVCFTLWVSSSACTGTTTAESDLCGFIEVEHDVGPLPLTTEIVTRFTAGIRTSTDGTPVFYYQDSGWEAHPWPYNESLTIPGNYKPLIHSGFVKSVAGDADPVELALVTRYTMGSVSAIDGQIEVMLQRNLNASDSQGPWPLADASRVRATLFLLAGEQLAVEAARPRLEAAANSPLALAYSPLSLGEWRAGGFPVVAAGLQDLQPQLGLMSLFVRDPTTAAASGGPTEYAIRIRHMYEEGAHPTLSAPVTLDITSILANSWFWRGAGNITEKSLTLAYDWPVSRRSWPTVDDDALTAPPPAAPLDEGATRMHSDGEGDGGVGVVQVGPGEIKSFVFYM